MMQSIPAKNLKVLCNDEEQEWGRGRGGEGRGGRMGGALLLTAVAWIPFPESGNSRSLTKFFRILTFKINKASNSNSRT